MQEYQYEQVAPPPALADVIECFWRILVPTMSPPSEIISAEGRAEILFQFEGQSQAIPLDADAPFECASSWLVRPFANGKAVYIGGGADVAQQYLRAGLVDELHINLVPVIFGEGIRLLDNLNTINLERLAVVEGNGVTHIKYRIGQ